MHVAVPGVATGQPHLLDDAGRVGDRVGVRHRMHGGEATERSGARAGLDRLGVFAAGLAQVRVQVDQARQRDQSVGVDHGGDVVRQPRADVGDHAAVEQDVEWFAAENARALQQPAGHDCIRRCFERRSAASVPIADSLPPSNR